MGTVYTPLLKSLQHFLANAATLGHRQVNNEFIATSAEILFSLANWTNPYYNTHYDTSFLVGSPNYVLPRLFHACMNEHHSGSASDITDDLIYNWLRSTEDSTEARVAFYGLAQALDAGSYGIPGSSPGDKLATLFHRYALARYVDDTSFSGGLYGFGDFSARFWRLFEWIDENGLLKRVEPPHFLVTPSDPPQTTSTFVATGDSAKSVECQTRDLGMRMWSSEYLVFHGNFSDRDLNLSLRTLDALSDSTEIRIGYIAYDASDSGSVLYDDTVLSVVESVAVVLDADTLRTDFTIPSFGTTNKGVVVVASLVPNPISPTETPCVDDVTLQGLTFLSNPTAQSERVILNEGESTKIENCSVSPSGGQTTTSAIEGRYGLTLLNSILEPDSWGVRGLSSPTGPAPDSTVFFMEGCILDS